jgi:hypothetical protein
MPTRQSQKTPLSQARWSAEERLIAERAVALHREVMTAMKNAPWGQGLAVTEGAVLDGGRTFLQELLQQALSAHAEAQKGGSAPVPVSVGKTPRSKRTPPKR